MWHPVQQCCMKLSISYPAAINVFISNLSAESYYSPQSNLGLHYFCHKNTFTWGWPQQHRSNTGQMASFCPWQIQRAGKCSCYPVHISWTVQWVFDTAPAAGAGSLTTAVTFPTDSSLSTFRRFSCLLILITYCLIVVKATFFSGLKHSEP